MVSPYARLVAGSPRGGEALPGRTRRRVPVYGSSVRACTQPECARPIAAWRKGACRAGVISRKGAKPRRREEGKESGIERSHATGGVGKHPVSFPPFFQSLFSSSSLRLSRLSASRNPLRPQPSICTAAIQVRALRLPDLKIFVRLRLRSQKEVLRLQLRPISTAAHAASFSRKSLGVVPDIDGERAVEQEVVDTGCQRMGLAKFSGFGQQLLRGGLVLGPMAGRRLPR